MPIFKSHGSGKFKRSEFAKIGKNVIFEKGVLVFYPENIEIGSNVYIGHNAILKGYHNSKMKIGNETWIGQNCFVHGAGGLTIGSKVGIGPGVSIFSSPHDLSQDNLGPINDFPSKYKQIVIEDGCNLGMGSIILGEVTLARGTQVGAGAVVTKSTKPFSIVVGIPAKLLRMRKLSPNVKKYQWDDKKGVDKETADE